MPIPPVDDDGFLPAGIHDCSLEEIGDRFGSFQRTDRRQRLFENLQAYVRELEGAAIGASLIISGSFVTAKPDPGDIDLVLVLPANFVLDQERPPFQYNVMSQRITRRGYGFDVVVAREGSLAY